MVWFGRIAQHEGFCNTVWHRREMRPRSVAFSVESVDSADVDALSVLRRAHPGGRQLLRLVRVLTGGKLRCLRI
jgi:hypothetical protein